jgi:hypothetical protein
MSTSTINGILRSAAHALEARGYAPPHGPWSLHAEALRIAPDNRHVTLRKVMRAVERRARKDQQRVSQQQRVRA